MIVFLTKYFCLSTKYTSSLFTICKIPPGWNISPYSPVLSVFGIHRKENILVYPIGLINTTIYIYLSIKGSLLGEASVNFYYTVMSIYGWILWAKRNEQQRACCSHQSILIRRWWTYQLSSLSLFILPYLFL